MKMTYHCPFSNKRIEAEVTNKKDGVYIEIIKDDDFTKHMSPNQVLGYLIEKHLPSYSRIDPSDSSDRKRLADYLDEEIEFHEEYIHELKHVRNICRRNKVTKV